ncbi:MAG: hypothetical protein ERJ67_05695 [Aphanocapsa feldmannii 277cV]|uniref:Uncharacterized protein n=2 Tax=Aphanocapsa feldmannii TaxID=192050 RepID=A0A524RNH9_9CHRO|nr:MAG: hypothetical protein ERJ69_05835 [Aphanocapsa feldmannii 288cV]TGG92578.1 MAG: hypothetical protein ERJ67_05695 [Aphanocapsa feldmannii 277cV]TGH20006.1 MAG: hypothetical protein ERJ68_07520 [Aphanocapsa feldmannii 277cI]
MATPLPATGSLHLDPRSHLATLPPEPETAPLHPLHSRECWLRQGDHVVRFKVLSTHAACPSGVVEVLNAERHGARTPLVRNCGSVTMERALHEWDVLRQTGFEPCSPCW